MQLIEQLGPDASGTKREIGAYTEIIALIAYLQRLGNNKRPVQTAQKKCGNHAEGTIWIL